FRSRAGRHLRARPVRQHPPVPRVPALDRLLTGRQRPLAGPGQARRVGQLRGRSGTGWNSYGGRRRIGERPSMTTMATADGSTTPPPGAGGRSVTIYDVAEAAGVAPSTVSRAFSRPGRVNAETGERIRELAEQMGYRAGPQARMHTPSRTGMLAVV